MSDVSNDCLVLHSLHQISSDDIAISCCGDEEICGLDSIFDGDDFVTFHSCLQRADRIDFCHLHSATLTTKTVSATLAHITEAEHNSCLAAQHHVCGAHDSVHT